jgi:ubiquinone/menaquinone biosynthesis C-methylase UbiE
MATPSRNTAETERVLGLYEKEAGKYDREMNFFDRLLFAGGREWVCSQATGDVLEIGIGTGRNLPHYRADVSLIGIELSPAMLEIARARARELGREVDLRVGDAQALEFPDDSFDAVVCTLSLCTIPDDRAAVAEVRRVLRPGGRFLLLEHVRSPVLPVRLGQRLLDPLAVRFEADHLLREPLEHLRAERFEVERFERSKLGIVERVVARKPAAAYRLGDKRINER